MKKEGLLYGTIILLISNFVIKCLGFFYRVFLVRVLGTEGIGLVEMVFPFYTFIIVITTWGIPLAMSKLLAEEIAKGSWGNVQKIFRLTLFLLTASGLIITILVIYFAPVIMEHFIADPRIYFCFVTMIPAVFIISVCSAFRAYFQGTKQVSTIGFGQTIEQIIRVMVGITLAIKLRKYGLEVAVVAVSVASVAGELAGLLFMIVRYHRKERKTVSSPTYGFLTIVKKLFTFGTPVTLTRLLASFLMTLQASLIPKGLMLAGNDLRTATEIYGRFSGVALSLLHLPGIVTMSMAVSIIPAVAELSDKGNNELLRYRVTEALWITTVFSVPSMVVLYYYAGELCSLIFHAPPAGEPLRILALGGIFCYLQQTLTSILQGMGRVKVLLFNNICSGICLIGGILLLTPIKGLEIKGAAIALSLSYFIGCNLNLFYLKRKAKIHLPFLKIFIKPILVGLLSLFVLRFLDEQLRLYYGSLPTAMIISVFLSSVIYFIFLFLTGGLPNHTIKRLPIINRWFS
ncbi:MAG: putative polysaccharide biosynthesis protein [Bacillota bacterium]|jgi:stage V sporulation protein B